MPTSRRKREHQSLHSGALAGESTTGVTKTTATATATRNNNVHANNNNNNTTRYRIPSEVELTTATATGITSSRRSLRERHTSTKSRRSASSSSKSSSTLKQFSSSHIHSNGTQPLFFGIRPVTWQASGILLVAMIASLAWNWYEQRHHHQYVDTAVQLFWQHICATAASSSSLSSSSSSYCHPGLVPQRRTLQTVRVLLPGQRLVQIPRRYTIWDVDALRDEWIQQELFVTPAAAVAAASPGEGSETLGSNTSQRPYVDSAAYLAVYLARLLTVKQHPMLEDPILREYLSILPQSSQDFDFHPVMWSEQDLELLGTHSLTFDHVRKQRNKIRDEYDMFTTTSSHMAQQISFADYRVARLLVLTRSFGTGPLSSNEAAATSSNAPLSDELAVEYQRAAGVDLSRGSHALVPVLDLYDHHAQPNVGFKYDTAQRAFVVTATAAIPSGRDIFDSYGKRTDPDLFAKYGFVNGDGSEYTEASLALWHSLGDDRQKQTRKQMLRYLQYDDGYEHCVPAPGSRSAVDVDEADAAGNLTQAWILKTLKYEYLLMHAHDATRWVVRMPPRDPLSRPMASLHTPRALPTPPEFDMHSLQFDGRLVFSTCRLISLAHNDYNGQAIELLQTNLHNASFYLPPTRDALEFRTLMCVARTAQTALAKFGVSLPEQLELVTALNQQHNQQPQPQHSRNWTVAHVRLGEMQTLDALKQTAYAGLRPFHDKVNTGPSYSMRQDPCPPQLLQPLLTRATARESW